MKKYFLVMLVVIVGLSLTGFVVAADDEIAMMDNGEEVVSNFEELAYVFRSKPNEALLEKAQEFCENLDEPFASSDFDGLDLYSINTKGADGSVVNWAVKKVGEVLTCSYPVGGGLNRAYFQVTLGRENPTIMEAFSFCQIMDVNIPEPGIFPMVCSLSIISAPPEYVGGLFVGNSLVGDPVTELGYKSSSIATLRIFKERN
jgi:hypothetical protein